jgi:hypothetical protein
MGLYDINARLLWPKQLLTLTAGTEPSPSIKPSAMENTVLGKRVRFVKGKLGERSELGDFCDESHVRRQRCRMYRRVAPQV